MPEELIGLMAYCTQNMAADSMVSVGPLWELKFCLGILSQILCGGMIGEEGGEK